MVGTGLSTLVWEDLWVPDLPSFIPKPREPSDFLPSLTVAQFIDHDRNEWDFGKLSQQFDEESVAIILNIPKRNWVQHDTWCWTFTTNG